MKHLIKIFEIFLKYGNIKRPIQCFKDQMVIDISPSIISKGDITKLKYYGVFVDKDSDCFTSKKFGTIIDEKKNKRNYEKNI